jgi:NADPH:quinone reductase-like Zn-dependent oxidoreductase
MKALMIREWGGNDKAVMEDVPVPQPAPGEVLVRIRAAGINPVDWKVREGYLKDYVSLPRILGSDFAGDVAALGEGVTDFPVATAVYGMKGFGGGAFAEYTTLAASSIAPKPASLTYAQAAAVPLAAVTAWHSLFEAGQIQPGQRVLIHAAAGGVGHFAVQFAKIAGAYVIGTASARNEAFVRGLGADEFVDYNAAKFESVVKPVDLVLDTVGFEVSTRSLDVLKAGGKLVCMVTPPPVEAAAPRQIQATYTNVQPTTAILTSISQCIEDKRVQPHISQTFSLDQIHEALQANQTQSTRGKIAVDFNN